MTRTATPRTVKRAVYRVPLAFAEKIDPGVVERIASPQTRSTLRNSGELSIAWIGPQLMRYLAELEGRVARTLQPPAHTPEVPDAYGREEDTVLEEAKRAALQQVFRIFQRTRARGPWWTLLLTVLSQIEAGAAAQAPNQPERRTRAR